MKNVVILGSTGSIGTQALDIIRQAEGRFNVVGLSCNANLDKIVEQVEEFSPKYVTIFDETQYKALKVMLSHKSTTVLSGMEGMIEMVTAEDVHVVLTAVVGNIGLRPTIEAIKAGKDIALANKETLVTSGSIIMPLAHANHVRILPVDSEHSAIFQCLNGEPTASVKRLLLTASGGAFRDLTKDQIQHQKSSQALKHPNWSMGRKITIDSATLMNKGLEFIEAHWLFDMPISKIEVLIHPQSIIHSMVEFKDHSVMAQLGTPDMRVPIIYALDYPNRYENNVLALDFKKMKHLTFEEPDFDRFPCLKIAMDAISEGGSVPTVMNAANEILVDAYLKDQIGFYDISEIIHKTMHEIKKIRTPNLDELLAIDAEARRVSTLLIENRKAR